MGKGGRGKNERGRKQGGGEEGTTLDVSPGSCAVHGCWSALHHKLGPRGHVGSGGRRWGCVGLGGPGNPHGSIDQEGGLRGSLLITVGMFDREGGGNFCMRKAEGKCWPV